MNLTEGQRTRFDEDGFLLVEDALEPADLAPVVADYEHYIERRARELEAAGELDDRCEGEPFGRRLALLCEQHPALFDEMDIMFMRGKGCFDFLRNERLLDWVEGFVGPEITCSPIQHVRAKLPTRVANNASAEFTHIAPWHQDASVTYEEADPYFILTVWIPIVEATLENGCMQVHPRQHHVGLRRHETLPATGTTIVPDEMPAAEPVSLPMQPGSVLFLHKQTPHRSTPNRSDGVRWSIDLRYQQTGTPTGRPFHPEFVVRSRANPASVLTDHDTWCTRWRDALAESTGTALHRWGVRQARPMPAARV